MRQHYVAVVHKKADPDIRAHLPDSLASLPPDQRSPKPTKRQRRRSPSTPRARSQTGNPPKPSGLSQILADPAYRTNVLALVPLELP
jgi:hypothetical protein